jgi:hypothetical protein
VALLFILFAHFAFAFLGISSGSTSQGSGRAGPPSKCSQQSSADTNKQQHCRGANP